jgi:hypothetical protein
MRIFNRKFSLKFHTLWKIPHAFRFSRYIFDGDYYPEKLQGTKDYEFWLEGSLFLVHTFFHRDESTWNSMEISLLGVGSPESNYLPLVGLSREYSWYYTDCDTEFWCIPPETEYTLKFLWGLKLTLKIVDYSKEQEDVVEEDDL